MDAEWIRDMEKQTVWETNVLQLYNQNMSVI
jgi:hypothetical protein